MDQRSPDGTPPKNRDRQLRAIAGRNLYFDWEGFLWDPQDWDEEVALCLARESGMEDLTDLHWQVIRFMRDFYFHNGRAPMNRDLKKGTSLTILELEKLLPGGIRRGIRRLAGLPNPKACL